MQEDKEEIDPHLGEANNLQQDDATQTYGRV